MGFDVYDPAAIAANPITGLIGCTTSYAPPVDAGTNKQLPAQDVATYFDALPPSIFNGDVFTVRIVGTPAVAGFLMSIWADKTNGHTGYNNPNYVKRQAIFSADGVAGHSSDVEKTEDFTVTVTDPAVKAKILAGDFVLQLGVVGGNLAGAIETVRSVSIAYTSYEVTFDGNGGIGTMTDATGALAANLPTSTFTRDGYLFNGWNDDQNGNGTAYADGAEYTFDADTTLYAQWIIDPSANSGGGGNDGSSDAANLPNTGVDSNAAFLAIGALMSLGILTTLTVIRRRRSS